MEIGIELNINSTVDKHIGESWLYSFFDTATRITEADDRRITEADDVRITEAQFKE